ncbi:hypothetical protein SAMN05192574_102501 [Mucilaginibacter gossypiicola]|uniref:Uncharacterized protein n=1 Tax=Mucilaginibacter gossypiicola TaxID=551995 RepID=A0A1H8DWV2_9SPHI|nr:hypothetical protein [Mucilaginibacter gossypiicola]SEN11789.1 hypothetical protein SAMN05192574_102501 [Mucilaginibacter gossypiicola]
MKKKILLFVPLLFTGCIMDYYDNRLSVINQSPVSIAVEIVNDTTKRTENNIEYYQSHAIAPNDTAFITKAGKNAWLQYIDESKDKTLYIYIFHIDTLNKYQKGGADMSYLLGSKKYLKRLDYTLYELKKSDWQIKYH